MRDTTTAIGDEHARSEQESPASLGVRTDYMWGGHHALFLEAGYTALGSGIRNSPLTDRAGESMLILGYMILF